ncbi:Hpt domain-containing protein [Mesorhizobium sp. WSM4307]|uniref:Hpt domain-containing protein n=1 Tax=unclassified Mesorhizobium TaxID=325217 RepID=UPI00115E3C40|nr:MULTISPECIES: Hpt domain-containing protein [unclassified Mesorhizobium]TRC75472.1 Hpt domain-containing protein [Mesorhizobium sp. WSM4315]TRC86519.1 Hpt domain-containing protein [Mesorhizobium sp. WSM4307]
MREKQAVQTYAAFCLNTFDIPLEHHPISNDAFAPLRQRFLARCADQLGQLKVIACEGGPLPRGAGGPLVRIAHSLAGAAGTFGFPDIGARASALETLLIEQPDEGAAQAALDALIAEIEQTLK